jgi:hypothetical protein
MGLVWAVWWVKSVRKCSRGLKSLPYLSTRYRQVRSLPGHFPFSFFLLFSHTIIEAPVKLFFRSSTAHSRSFQLSFSFFVWLSLWLGLYMMTTNIYALTQLEARYIYVSSRDYNDTSQMVRLNTFPVLCFAVRQSTLNPDPFARSL